MQKIHQDSSTLVEEQPINLPHSVRRSLKKFQNEEKGLKSDLNLIVTTCSGKPLAEALISIDMVGITAVTNQSGMVYIKDLPTGRYCLDIISPGFVAKSIMVCIDKTGCQELYAELVSNIG